MNLGLAAPGRFLVVFICVSYLVWLRVFGVLGYTVPIEVFTGTLVVLALQLLTAPFFQLAARPLATLLCLLLPGSC